jgi:hypothetical protein
MLCDLPINCRRVWADCCTKALALVVDITASHRSDSVRLCLAPPRTERAYWFAELFNHLAAQAWQTAT